MIQNLVHIWYILNKALHLLKAREKESMTQWREKGGQERDNKTIMKAKVNRKALPLSPKRKKKSEKKNKSVGENKCKMPGLRSILAVTSRYIS